MTGSHLDGPHPAEVGKREFPFLVDYPGELQAVGGAVPTREDLSQWWTEDPPAWGVVTGAISGVVILDFDSHQGLASLSQLGVSPHVRTGPGGAHLYLRHSWLASGYSEWPVED